MFKFLPLISVKDITNAIFDAIVSPISNAVGKVISSVMDVVINGVLIPVLGPFFEGIVEPIMGLIGNLLLSWLHIRFFFMYVGVLRFIDILEYAFNVFGGISDVKVIQNGQESSDFLLNVFFSNNAITNIFWAITLLAFAVSLIFGIIAVMKSATDLDGNRPVGKVLGSIAKTGLTFLIVPFFMVFALNMTNVVIKKTSEILATNMGEEPISIGAVLFLATTLEAGGDDELSGFTDGVRADYYTGDKDYWDFDQVSNDFNIAEIQVILGLGMSLFVGLMLIICSFVFITRIFEVLLLYIASPFFVATIPLDDGAKFGEWRNMFIAKLCAGFGMLIGMKLYIMLVPVIMSSNLVLSSVNFVDMGLKILLVLGGAFAIYKCNSLLMQILNVQASYGEMAYAAKGLGMIKSAAHHGKQMFSGKNFSPAENKERLGEGNKNPNLSTWKRTEVSSQARNSGKREELGRRGVVIGANRQRASQRSNIEIGSHRKRAGGFYDVDVSKARNSRATDIKIGGHRDKSDTKRQEWKSPGVTDKSIRSENVTIGRNRSWQTASVTDRSVRSENITIGGHRAWQTETVTDRSNRRENVTVASTRTENSTWKNGTSPSRSYRANASQRTISGATTFTSSRYATTSTSGARTFTSSSHTTTSNGGATVSTSTSVSPTFTSSISSGSTSTTTSSGNSVGNSSWKKVRPNKKGKGSNKF